MKKLALLLALASCAPTYRIVTKRCPTVTMLLGDFGISAAAMALSIINYNLGHKAGALGLAGASMSLGIGGNLAETTCRK